MNVQIIHRESRTEQPYFATKPARAAHAALRASGWRWNGIAWWKNTNETTVRKPREIASIIVPEVEAAVG